MTQNLKGLEWFGSKKDCWDVVNNIIAFKAMTQNMTADDWFLPKKTAMDWYGSKREKYGADCWGVSLFYKSLLRGIKPQKWLIWIGLVARGNVLPIYDCYEVLLVT